MDNKGPKWRLEHASNGRAVCQQAACKRARAKIEKGELRIGTHTLFDNGIETRWYMAWRHWGCATKQQIAGLVETTSNDPTVAPGYKQLSPEGQEQIRLAFELGRPSDKEFKGIREDLAKNAQRYATEFTNAAGYKVDVAVRAAACRGNDCLAEGIKIGHDELRLGILVPFDEGHSSLVYKHWRCISALDLAGVMRHTNEDELDGLSALSDELREVVMETIGTGKIVEPPRRKTATLGTAKKAKTEKTKAQEAAKGKTEESRVTIKEEDVEMEDALTLSVQAKPKNSQMKEPVIDNIEANSQPEPENVPKNSQIKKHRIDEVNRKNEPEPKHVPKKTRTKKQVVKKVEDSSESEPEYVPKKSKSRSVPFKEASNLYVDAGK